jgi:hypothetical protein
MYFGPPYKVGFYPPLLLTKTFLGRNTMKKRFLISMLLATFYFLMSLENVYAVGLGGYLEYSAGSGTFDDYFDVDVDVDTVGFGFVLDTNVSRDNVFNYRLHFGYNALDIGIPGSNIDGYRIMLDNTFGFGIIRMENFRWWMGPQLHLNYSNWDIPIGGDYFKKDSIDFFGMGIGIATGMNFNLPGIVTISPELGIRYQYNWSDTYEEHRYSYYNYYYDEQDFSYDEWVVFTKISLLFRFGERPAVRYDNYYETPQSSY